MANDNCYLWFRSARNKQNRKKHSYKVSSMIIGGTTAAISLGCLVVSIILLTSGLSPLESFLISVNDTASDNITTMIPLPTDPQNGAIEEPEEKKSKPNKMMNIFAGTVSLALMGIIIPNAVHFIVSVRLIYGAWMEETSLVEHWISFTKKTGSLHFAFIFLVAISLLVSQQKLLAMLLLILLILLTMTVVCLVSIVQQYHTILDNRHCPPVFFKNTDDNGSEGTVEETLEDE